MLFLFFLFFPFALTSSIGIYRCSTHEELYYHVSFLSSRPILAADICTQQLVYYIPNISYRMYAPHMFRVQNLFDLHPNFTFHQRLDFVGQHLPSLYQEITRLPYPQEELPTVILLFYTFVLIVMISNVIKIMTEVYHKCRTR